MSFRCGTQQTQHFQISPNVIWLGCRSSIWSHVFFAETFSSTLTSEEENAGMGGIAMLTLSDTENNLHFILILQGLIKHKEEGEINKCKKEQRVSTDGLKGRTVSKHHTPVKVTEEPFKHT